MRSSPVAAPVERPESTPRPESADAPAKAPSGPRFADLLQQRRAAEAPPPAARETADAAPPMAGKAAAPGQKAVPSSRPPAPPTRDAAANDDRPAATEAAGEAAPAAAATVEARTRADDAHDRTDDDSAAGTPLPIAGDAATQAPSRPTPADTKAPGDEAALARASSARAAPGEDAAIAPTGGGIAAAASEAALAGTPEAATTADVARHLAPAESALPSSLPIVAPQHVATTGHAAPSVTLPVSPHAPRFAELLGTQVSVFARDGLQQAELRLNPPEMGPIGVRIDLDGSLARVDFHAAQAATREVIQRALPELAAALRAEGLTLAGGGVFDRPADARGDADERPGARPRRGAASGAAPAAARALRYIAPQGAVDLYA